MENTLDSIRPSVNPQDDMSYLFGRDPSILAYSQRPFLSKDARKNLFSLYETEESNSPNEHSSEQSGSTQTVKVYLRLKPFPKKLKLTEEQQEAFKILNSTTLATRIPMLDNNVSCVKQSKSSEIIRRKFIFSQTFGPETTQLELFKQTVQPQMIDFLAGHNCTIMTYGTTNSGKSYTLQGTPTSPGIIPRALEFLFSNITTRASPAYKPLHYSNVVSIDALERAQELEVKTKLLTFSSVDKYQYINAYKQMQKLLQEESVRPSECHDAHHLIWVSFAEIYNETVYDLLSNECQKKRTPLKLGTDSSGRAFIRGLKTVHVNSATEAYQVLMAGQYNLKVAATALNAKSSRSHCLFTITLLKYYAENSPDTVESSMFSFCDLAGSERLKKTLNIGDRLKEAQNINTSLLVLGRCLKSIHEGQLTKSKADAIGPFRESKLTRLFQRALSGKEHLALIVNVNPLPNLYVETQNVLNFAAIAKKIVIEEKERVQKKSRTRFSKIVTQSIETVTDWDAAELENGEWHQISMEKISEYVSSEEYMDLAEENEKLKNEIAALKNSALIRDFQSRQELADKYLAMINELEANWKQRINDVEIQHEDALEWSVKQVQEFYEGKLNQLHRKKRRANDSYNDSNFNITFEEIDKENKQLTEKIDTLKKKLTEIKIANETLIVEKNKATFELGLSRDDLKVANNLLEAARQDISFNRGGEIYVKEMTSQLLAKEEHIKKLKEILNEAKEEYITVTSDLRRAELRIDDQARTIIENKEKIEDLESHLEQVNVCLTEKTSVVEVLETKLEVQTEKLSDAENKISELQEEIKRLKEEKLALLKCSDEKPSFVQTTAAEDSGSKSEVNTSELPEISQTPVQNKTVNEELIIKEEFIIQNVSQNLSNATQETAQENMKTSLQSSIETKAAGCQINIDDLEKNTCSKASQTTAEDSKMTLQEQAVQTTETLDDKLKLEELTTRYNDIQAQCKKECLKVEQLTEELQNVKKTVLSLGEENKLKETIINEYKYSIENLEKDLSSVTEEKRKVEEALAISEESQKKITDYEITIDKYKHSIETLQKELSSATEEKRKVEEALAISEESQKKITDYEITIDKYKNSIETLQKELSSATEERRKVEEALITSTASQKKVTDYEHKIEQLEKNLTIATDNVQRYLEMFESTNKELDNHLLKCKEEKEEKLVGDRLVKIKEECDIKTTDDIKYDIKDTNVQQIDKQIDDIEANLKTISELSSDIAQLNKNLEICQNEKNQIQNALDENNKKLFELNNRLKQNIIKEQEKDTEIATLQKELKHMIQKSESTNETDNCMEAELKRVISELAQTKETLSQKDQHIKELTLQLENFKQNGKLYNLLEENAKERQVENARLRNINDELRNNLTQKEREMDVFIKNRDETITKYETLVKNQQEELDRQKREVMRFQELFRKQLTPTPHKDDYKKLQNRIQDLEDKLQKYKGNTKAKDRSDIVSEDDVSIQQLPKRRGKKAVLSTKQENIPTIELSGSESKRSTRTTASADVTTETSSTRRTTRRKKLFFSNDSYVDVEPSEEATSTAHLSTRKLRSRKK